VPDLIAHVARLRVPLGFVTAAVVMLLARPSWGSIAAGAAIASIGEALRVWAAGHLEKSREVTKSGPYRWFRHPLYVGSTILGAGVCAAAGSVVAAALVLVYLAVTLRAAIVTEEQFLRSAFGTEYDDYSRGRSAPQDRPFSWERAWRNREWRAVLGVGAALAILVLKAHLLE